MFFKFTAQKTADWLLRNNRIIADKREIYEFGLEKLFSSFANIFFLLLFGFVLGIALPAAMFYLAYVLIRVYAGGYHSDNPLICFFVSIAVLIPCLFAIRFYRVWNVPVAFWSLLALSITLLVLISPVEHKNKPLEAIAKCVYRRRMLRNLTLISTSAAILSLLTLGSYSAAILCGLVLSATTACVGKMTSRMSAI